MSNEMKKAIEKARKAKDRCNGFKFAALITGLTAVVMFVLAAIFPPPWQVHESILQGMGICAVIVALFETGAAVEAGVDAKLHLSKEGVKLNLDNDEHQTEEEPSDE